MNATDLPGSAARFSADRARLVADPTLVDVAFPRACTALTDEWLSIVFDEAIIAAGVGGDGLALVALGGYGRGELCPGSDLDLLLVYDGRTAGAAAVAEAIWYPVWDTGVKLGHAMRSLDEVVEVIGVDVESTTAMVDGRLLRGDAEMFGRFTADVAAAWTRRAPRSMAWFRADATARHERFGEVAFAVEPNIKLGHGGLRDAQAPAWLAAAGMSLLDDADARTLADASSTLLEVRVAMQRSGPRIGDNLRLEDQDQVAARLGEADADDLMRRVAKAGRAITWVCDELWASGEGAGSAGPGRRRSRRAGSTAVDTSRIAAEDPVGVLRAAALVAAGHSRFARAELDRFMRLSPPLSDPWPPGAREAFVDLLAAGHAAVGVIESLDHVGLWERILPEWKAVRSRPQRTTHHLFTVDRHLLEAVAVAATLTDRVSRPDLLLLAALFHDLGKGQGGKHSEIGVTLVGTLGSRMGLDDDDIAVLVTLVRHHLLLPEVATRRDLGDAATLDLVADAVGSVEVLALLLALTEADARATGPSAWTDWKAGLVATLGQRTEWRLSGDRSEQYGPVFPSVEQMLLLRAGVTSVVGEGHKLTVVAPDQPGLFSRVAGVLVLRGLNVAGADATSSDGMALEEFTVSSAFASAEMSDSVPIDWSVVVADIERAMAGRFAIEARVAERASTYRRRALTADTEVRVRFDDSVADVTVLEVDAPDGVGLLYRVTRALGELSVDIHQARVETRTDRVVDAFSIVDIDGRPVTDEAYRAEIERAVRFAAGS